MKIPLGESTGNAKRNSFMAEAESASRQSSETEDLFRTVFFHSATANAIVDEDGTISLVNHQFERTTGYKKEEVEGKVTWEQFVAPEDIERLQDYFAMRSGNPQSVPNEYEFTMVDKAGRKRTALCSGAMLGKTKKRIISALDISEDKELRRDLERKNRALWVVSRVNRTLAAASSEQELLNQCCRTIVEAATYLFAYIGYAKNDEEKSVRIVASGGVDEQAVKRLARSFKITWTDGKLGRGPTGTAIRTESPCVIRDVATDERAAPWREMVMDQGIASAVSLPLGRKGKPIGALTICSSEVDAFDEEEVELLAGLARDLTFGIYSMRSELARQKAQRALYESKNRLQKTLSATIRSMGTALEVRDPYTAGHQARVGAIAVLIADQMGLPRDLMVGLHMAADVHDIGKLSVPTSILSKPTKLSEAEMTIIQGHPKVGHDILKGIEFPWPIAKMILQHHERLDGSGYPNGLFGEQILLEAKIMAVADVLDAMASHRPYRPAMTIEKAMSEIHHGKGFLYDSEVVEACKKLLKEGKLDTHLPNYDTWGP